MQEDISVVIPTLGRPLLEGCLESILEGTVWPEAVVVVDQSPDRQAEVWLDRLRAKGLNLLYVHSSQRGVAAATNRGIERVRTRFVAITHDDCQVRPDWLGRMAARLAREPMTVISGRVDPGGEGVVVSVKSDPVEARYTRPSLRGDLLFPNNMGCPRSIFDVVGPFDESRLLRTAAEDNDWSYRALREGVPILYCPDVAVIHLDWRDEQRLQATYRAYAYSQGAFYGKNLRRGDLFIALRAVLALGRAVLRWARGLLTSDHDLVANGRAFTTRLLPGLIAGLRASAWRTD